MTDEFVTYDPSSGTYRAEYSLDERSGITETIVFGIAQIRERDPADLEPLGQVVDTDALGSLFTPVEEPTPSISVTFEYGGFVVTVRGDETITFESVD